MCTTTLVQPNINSFSSFPEVSTPSRRSRSSVQSCTPRLGYKRKRSCSKRLTCQKVPPKKLKIEGQTNATFLVRRLLLGNEEPSVLYTYFQEFKHLLKDATFNTDHNCMLKENPTINLSIEDQFSNYESPEQMEEHLEEMSIIWLCLIWRSLCGIEKLTHLQLLEYIELVMACFPQSAFAIYTRGRIASIMNQPQKAYYYYTSSLQIASLVMAFQDRASLLLNEFASYQDALEDLAVVMVLSPLAEFDALSTRARCLAQHLDSYEEAIEEVNDFIAHHTNDAQGYLLRSELVYLYGNNISSARKDINESIHLDPSNSQAYIIRAHLYPPSECESAISDLNTAIEIDPCAQHYTSRGYFIEFSLHNPCVALDDYIQALSISPTLPSAQTFYASCYQSILSSSSLSCL